MPAKRLIIPKVIAALLVEISGMEIMVTMGGGLRWARGV